MPAPEVPEIPALLYHYQPVVGDEYEERLRRMLLNQEIYCPSAAQFNDPWDCCPNFDVDDFHEFARGSEGIASLTAICNSPDIDQNTFTRLLQDDPLFRAKFIFKLGAHVKKNADERWRLYCLSPSPLISLMWSHYACGHTGICLEFDTANLYPRAINKVSYSRVLPKHRLRGASDTWPRELFLTKSTDWSYEDEYRLMARTQAYVSLNGTALPIARNGLLELPLGALRSIIIGCRGNSHRVKKITSEFGIPVRSVVRAPDSYGLVIRDS